MNNPRTLIDELEDALPSRSMAERANVLRRITDLFLFGSAKHSDAEMTVFDDVMTRLAAEIETSMRAELARRLAAIPNVPPNLIRKLASDMAIEVAGPVLTSSPQLDDDALVGTAKTASQDHLLAISQRASIRPPVTDELVQRGDRTVALSVVGNEGAQFSDHGQFVLLERSKDDDELAVGLWSRRDIPHHQLLKLLNVASENVRRTLETLDRQRTNLIRNTVVEVSNDLQNRLRIQVRDYSTVHRMVAALHDAGELDGAKIQEFASSGQFEATTLALSMLCDLPIGACERAMVQARAEMVLLLAKAVGLSWDTTRAIVRLRVSAGGLPEPDLDSDMKTFCRLRHETARKAIQFVRMRERGAMARDGITFRQ
jgi:uncharacterized protein (DUF2336 family)